MPTTVQVSKMVATFLLLTVGMFAALQYGVPLVFQLATNVGVSVPPPPPKAESGAILPHAYKSRVDVPPLQDELIYSLPKPAPDQISATEPPDSAPPKRKSKATAPPAKPKMDMNKAIESYVDKATKH